MKSSLTLKIQMIVIITVIVAVVSVFLIFFYLSYNVLLSDIQDRSNNVKRHVEGVLTTDSFEAAYGGGFDFRTQEALEQFREIASIKHLFIARGSEATERVIAMNSLSGAQSGAYEYSLTDEMLADLQLSLSLGQAVGGSGIYKTEHGRVYTIFWPVFGRDNVIVGSIGMEFDVDSIYQSYRQAMIYTMGIAALLIVLFCLVSYLSLRKVSEPYYKKLAYADILTGLQNRMSYEHRIRSCEMLISQGKSVSLIMFDVNNLKVVNDTLGHEIGDQYIINTTKIIKEILGGLGELYRIGGDEFAAIVVNRSKNEIDKALNALQTEQRMVIKNHSFSCACGAATFTPGVDASIHGLASRADEEMYKEKRKQKERLKGGRRLG